MAGDGCSPSRRIETSGDDRYWFEEVLSSTFRKYVGWGSPCCFLNIWFQPPTRFFQELDLVVALLPGRHQRPRVARGQPPLLGRWGGRPSVVFLLLAAAAILAEARVRLATAVARGSAL